ncbi:Hypothetical protein POVR1_LOCUS248 [uncultured virus]|nr:Hypothetical protein POVR1_LOCUS248 [uncultured virus]
MQAAIRAIANLDRAALRACRPGPQFLWLPKLTDKHYLEVLIPICFHFQDQDAVNEILSWETDREIRAEMIRKLLDEHKEFVQQICFFKLLLSHLPDQVHFSDCVITSAIGSNDREIVCIALRCLHKYHKSNDIDFLKIARALKGKDEIIRTSVIGFLNQMPHRENFPYQTIGYLETTNQFVVAKIKEIVKVEMETVESTFI